MSSRYPPLFKRASNNEFRRRKWYYRNTVSKTKKIKTIQRKITEFMLSDGGIGCLLSRIDINPPYRQVTVDIEEPPKRQLTLEECPKFHLKFEPPVSSPAPPDPQPPYAWSEDCSIIDEDDPIRSNSVNAECGVSSEDMEMATHDAEEPEDCSEAQTDAGQVQEDLGFGPECDISENSSSQKIGTIVGNAFDIENVDCDLYFNSSETVMNDLAETANFGFGDNFDLGNGFPDSDQILSQGFYWDSEVLSP